MPKRDISQALAELEAGTVRDIRMNLGGTVYAVVRDSALKRALAILRNLDARTGTVDPRVKRERKRATRLARGEI